MKIARALAVLALLAAPVALAGCDSNDNETSTEYRDQLEDAQLDLTDAIEIAESLSEDGIVIEVNFEAGVDSGYFEVFVIEGDDELTFMIDAVTGEVHDSARRRAAADRAERARYLAHLRRRLAQFVRDEVRDRPDHRAIRARLRAADVRIDLMDDRGRKVRRHPRLSQ